MPRHLAAALASWLLAPLALTAQARPTVDPADYGKWESLATSRLSSDGRWLAYGVQRVSEENELRLRPIARDTTIVVPRAAEPLFSGDARWLAYAILPTSAERARLEKEKKPIRNALGLRNLATGSAIVVSDVQSFRFSADGRALAMRRYPAEGKRAAELLVQELATGRRLAVGNVGDWAWSDGRALLAMAIESDGGQGNAVQLYDAATGAIRVLDSSPSVYRALAWRKAGDDLAVLRSVADAKHADTAHVVLAWTRVSSGEAVRRELDPRSAAGFPSDMRVAEHRRPEWARDGSMVYVGLRPRELARRADSTTKDGAARADSSPEKISDVQVWHSRDVRIMPMQKVQEQQDLHRTLLAAWRPADGRVVPIGTMLLETARVLPGDRWATETDRTPYAFGQMFGRPFQDVYVVDVRTGERRKALEKVRYFFGASATGKQLLSFDGKDYWATDVATLARTNLTSRVSADFTDREFDYPHDFLPPEGVAGWTTDDRTVLVYDAHDVWALAADGSGARRLTDGAAEDIAYRYARTRPDDEGIDLSRPVYLSLAGRHSKKTGFAVLPPKGAAQRLVLDDARLFRLARADSADVYAFTKERFDDSPDWFVGGAALGAARQVSATNPFQASYAWGRSEVMDFTSATGRPLQAALFYPANFDPARKYPMIVYTYERLSQNVHNYVVPTERNYYDVTTFTQDGYFVLMPDIVFRDREPGLSTLEAVVPAVRAVVAKGLVDSSRVGHVGHSWGGYEATFLPTRTHIFAASVAGAPITNFLSFAGAIHWTPGIAEFDHWETGQARMGVPPWEDLEAYLRNSPAAKVQELKTPMLMEVGDADGTVDWHQGLEFYNFARRAGRRDFVLLVYPGEDHGLRKKENQIDYHRRIRQWFAHYLKGEPAPAWMTDGTSWLDRKATLEAAKP